MPDLFEQRPHIASDLEGPVDVDVRILQVDLLVHLDNNCYTCVLKSAGVLTILEWASQHAIGLKILGVIHLIVVVEEPLGVYS